MGYHSVSIIVRNAGDERVTALFNPSFVVMMSIHWLQHQQKEGSIDPSQLAIFKLETQFFKLKTTD